MNINGSFKVIFLSLMNFVFMEAGGIVKLLGSNCFDNNIKGKSLVPEQTDRRTGRKPLYDS